MLKRFLFSAGVLIILLLLQSTWMHAIAVYGVIPDLSLVAIIFIAFRNPGLQGQVLGLGAGLLQDSISGAPLGYSAFIKTAIAWTANALSGKFYIDRIFMPFVFGFTGTLLKALYAYFLSILFGPVIESYNFLGYVLWLEAGLNAVSALVLFWILSRLEKVLLTAGSY